MEYISSHLGAQHLTGKGRILLKKNFFDLFQPHLNFSRQNENSNVVKITKVSTMLQKLSKCEVKAWLCWNLIILPSLRFYVKPNFYEFKQSKKVIFGNFRGSEFWFCKFEQLSSSKFTKNSKFRVSKIARNDIFGPFEFTKIGIHVKSQWR